MAGSRPGLSVPVSIEWERPWHPDLPPAAEALPGGPRSSALRVRPALRDGTGGTMKFGIIPTEGGALFQEALAEVVLAEELGFDSVWMEEHHSHHRPLLAVAAGRADRVRGAHRADPAGHRCHRHAVLPPGATGRGRRGHRGDDREPAHPGCRHRLSARRVRAVRRGVRAAWRPAGGAHLHPSTAVAGRDGGARRPLLQGPRPHRAGARRRRRPSGSAAGVR